MSFYHRKQFLEEYKDRFQKILIKDAKEFPVKVLSVDAQYLYKNNVDQIVTLIAQIRSKIGLFSQYFSEK